MSLALCANINFTSNLANRKKMVFPYTSLFCHDLSFLGGI